MLIQINANIVATLTDSIHVQEFSLLDDSIGKNVIIFGVDMSSSMHIDDERIR